MDGGGEESIKYYHPLPGPLPSREREMRGVTAFEAGIVRPRFFAVVAI